MNYVRATGREWQHFHVDAIQEHYFGDLMSTSFPKLKDFKAEIEVWFHRKYELLCSDEVLPLRSLLQPVLSGSLFADDEALIEEKQDALTLLEGGLLRLPFIGRWVFEDTANGILKQLKTLEKQSNLPRAEGSRGETLAQTVSRLLLHDHSGASGTSTPVLGTPIKQFPPIEGFLRSLFSRVFAKEMMEAAEKKYFTTDPEVGMSLVNWDGNGLA